MTDGKDQKNKNNTTSISLPEPRLDSEYSIEKALKERESIRQYANQPLDLQEIAQLLWSAQGITHDSIKKTAPSAGATYPLEVYLVAGNVDGLEPGVYNYKPGQHSLEKINDKDLRSELASAALGQNFIKEAPADIVITAEYERTTSRYGDRGTRYVHMEAGHAAQNVYLQAEALDLGTVVVGAFHDNEIKELMNVTYEPLYILPVGKL